MTWIGSGEFPRWAGPGPESKEPEPKEQVPTNAMSFLDEGQLLQRLRDFLSLEKELLKTEYAQTEALYLLLHLEKVQGFKYIGTKEDTKCTVCKGSGTNPHFSEYGDDTDEPCKPCNGTGKEPS